MWRCTDDYREKVLTIFHFLRQQMDKPAGQFNHCLRHNLGVERWLTPNLNYE